MNEQELPNLRGVGDRFIADVDSLVLNEIFCLVVPTYGVNCCLSDSYSLRIGTCGGVPVDSPMLKFDKEIENVRMSVL